MSDSRELRQRLALVQSPGVAKCSVRALSAAEQHSRECAIEDLIATMQTFRISQRELARLNETDLSTVQEWLADGRKRLPWKVLNRLPRDARAFLLGRMIDRLGSDSSPPSRTGTDR